MDRDKSPRPMDIFELRNCAFSYSNEVDEMQLDALPTWLQSCGP